MANLLKISDIAGHEFTVNAASTHDAKNNIHKNLDIKVKYKLILYVVTSHKKIVLETPSITRAVNAFNEA